MTVGRYLRTCSRSLSFSCSDSWAYGVSITIKYTLNTIDTALNKIARIAAPRTRAFAVSAKRNVYCGRRGW